MVEISRAQPEPTSHAALVEETSKEEIKAEVVPQKEVVASEDLLEVVQSPVAAEVIASSVEPEVEPSIEAVMDVTPIAQEVVQEEPSSPEIVDPSTFNTPSFVQPTREVTEMEPSPSVPTLETQHDEQLPHEVLVPAKVVVPSSPTLPPVELVQDSEPSPSLVLLGKPIEEISLTPEPTPVEDTNLTVTPALEEPSPPSVVPSSRNSFETAPLAPSLPSPSASPTLPVDEIFEVTIPQPITPTLEFDDPETPTAPTHVEEKIGIPSSDPEATEETRTMEEVAEIVVETVEVAACRLVDGVVELLQEVGVVANGEEVEGREPAEEQKIAQVRPLAFSL